MRMQMSRLRPLAFRALSRVWTSRVDYILRRITSKVKRACLKSFARPWTANYRIIKATPPRKKADLLKFYWLIFFFRLSFFWRGSGNVKFELSVLNERGDAFFVIACQLANLPHYAVSKYYPFDFVWIAGACAMETVTVFFFFSKDLATGCLSDPAKLPRCCRN